jgi:5'-deoxynucleotidase YfbR-like HD superfamily hydrolase
MVLAFSIIFTRFVSGIISPVMINFRYELAHGEDKSALLTKDLDKFDMVVQAFEYEEKEKRFGGLEDFFRSTSSPDLFKHPAIKKWNTELRILREEKILGKQKLSDNGGS